MAYKTFKSKYRSNPYKRTRRGKYSRRTGRSFQARVNKALMRKAETKYYDIAEENVQLYHNLGYSAVTPVVTATKSIPTLFNCWADITQGTGRSQRVGDKIYPRGLSLKIWLANKLDRPNVMYRVIVCRAPKAIAGALTAFDTQPFDTATLGSTSMKLQLPLDQDRGFRALYDRVIRLESGTSGTAAGVNKECHKQIKIWIKRKKSRPIVYNNSASLDIVNNPLMFYVIPYDSYGTVFSDNIASCAYYARMYFKDI